MTKLRFDGVTIDDWAHEGGRSGAESDQQKFAIKCPHVTDMLADERARHFAQNDAPTLVFGLRRSGLHSDEVNDEVKSAGVVYDDRDPVVTWG